MSYSSLAKDVAPGSQILCADGSITFTVLSCNVDAGTVQVRAENSAKLGERKNMNLPGVNVDLPTITEKDRDDILNWGVKNKVDFIAASFVRKGSDIEHIREVLGPASKDIFIISKVENMEGLDNFSDIVEKSDGVMVARGDLGMEIRMEQIFLAQKRMIKRCNEAGKFVVTATQMLESMTGAPRPTRAEATDVANAVLDGTDAVMLSGETAAGSYPVEAVSIMADICRESEAYVDNYAVFKNLMDHQSLPMNPLESLASSAVRSARRSSSEAERVNARRAFTAIAGAVASAAETRGSTRAISLDAAPASPGSSSAITLTRFRGIRIEARGLDAANCAESKALRTSPCLDSHAAAISPGDTRLPSAAATNDA